MIDSDEWLTLQDYPLFDASKIMNLSAAITPDKAKEFARNYVQSLEEQCALIIRGIGELDFYTVEFNTHKLASGSGTFGHMYLHHIFIYIEKYAMEHKIAAPFSSQSGVDLLKKKIDQSIQEMQSYLNSM